MYGRVEGGAGGMGWDGLGVGGLVKGIFRVDRNNIHRLLGFVFVFFLLMISQSVTVLWV